MPFHGTLDTARVTIVTTPAQHKLRGLVFKCGAKKHICSTNQARVMTKPLQLPLHPSLKRYICKSSRLLSKNKIGRWQTGWCLIVSDSLLHRCPSKWRAIKKEILNGIFFYVTYCRKNSNGVVQRVGWCHSATPARFYLPPILLMKGACHFSLCRVWQNEQAVVTDSSTRRVIICHFHFPCLRRTGAPQFLPPCLFNNCRVRFRECVRVRRHTANVPLEHIPVWRNGWHESLRSCHKRARGAQHLGAELKKNQ